MRSREVPPEDRLDSAIWKVLSVAIIGSFLSQMDATIVNVSLSSLATQLQSFLSTIQWVTSGYLLALALMLPLNGWMVDRFGAKRVYLACFLLFTLSSVLCGCSWSANSLIGFRILQGACGGMMAPMAQMMVARAAGSNLARVLGYAAMPVLLAPILGPVIAGAILQYASWRWLFFVNLPVGILALVLALTFLPNDDEMIRSRQFDAVGFALLPPGLVLFLLGSDHLEEPVGIAAIVLSIVLLGAFVKWASLKEGKALVDVRLFRSKIFSTSAITQFVSNGVSYSGQLLVPVFLIRACGVSPSGTGLLLAPLGLGMMCTFPLVGNWSKRFGIRKVAATGAFVALLGMVPFLFFAARGLDVPVLVVAQFVRGVGMSAIGIPSISSAYASVPREELPMATTAINIVQRLGAPTLTNLCAVFLAWRMKGSTATLGLDSPYEAVFLLVCTLQVLLLVSSLRLPRDIAKEDPAKLREAVLATEAD